MKWLRKNKKEKKETKGLKLSVKSYLFPPVHARGVGFASIALLISLAFICWCKEVNLLGLIFLEITLAIYYFFRNPSRVVPQGEDLIVAPADGIVSNVTTCVPPKDMCLGEEPLTRVSIFMSVFDVHINRSPMTGKITHMHYIPGKFCNIADKDNEDNERNEYTLETEDGVQIGFVQIAGLIARRIVPFVQEGFALKTGERFGLICFGSRVDVYLPKGVASQVLIGQKMVAGETIIARLGVQETQYNGESI